MEESDIQILIEKNPEVKSLKPALALLKEGACCFHRSWGLGLIKEYSADDNKLVIDFKEKAGHKMDPAFCITKLKVISKNSLLARKQTEPEVVQDLIENSPCEVIIEILKQHPKGQTDTLNIEGALFQLFDGSTYKKWWTKTKSLLVKHPSIQTPIRKSDPYILRNEPVKLEHEILEDFYFLKHPKKKILLAEKLHKLSDNVEEIAEDLPNIFEHLTNAISETKRFSEAEQLRGIWVRNDLARHLDEDPDLIEPTSKSLILKVQDLSALAGEIPSAQQKRLLDLIVRTHPEDWLSVLLGLLRDSAGKLTTEIIAFLSERDHAEEAKKRLEGLLDEQNLKAPLIFWIIRNRNTRKFKELVSNLINVRLFNNLLHAVEEEALQNVNVKKIPLCTLLSEDKELIPDLLTEATETQAKDLAQGLLSNQGFEDLPKRSILVRFIRRFPSIETYLSGAAEQRTEDLIVSQESLGRVKKEYEELVSVKIPENKKAIETAREHGDLRENSKYKMAREDQELLLSRKEQLDRGLAIAQITDFKEATNEEVSIGSIVTLSREGSAKEKYAILGAWDSDPENNILSYKTPLAQALLGEKNGAVVSTNIGGNEVKWQVSSITRWLDSKRKLSS